MVKRTLAILALLFVIITVFASKTNAFYQETEMDKKKLFRVVKVIDGDTITFSIRGKNESVRLLGIDTPESVDPRRPIQCFAKEATNKMKSFIDGKFVILIDDNTQGNRDKYKRLLRYVYLADSVRTFVNGEMVKQGYAFSYRQYPTKMLGKFNRFEKYAREHNLGLWGSCPLNDTPTKASARKYTAPRNKPTSSYIAPIQNGSSGGFTCSGKITCSQMTSCAEAYFYLNTCGVSRLDGDKDGTPCETICR